MSEAKADMEKEVKSAFDSSYVSKILGKILHEFRGHTSSVDTILK